MAFFPFYRMHKSLEEKCYRGLKKRMHFIGGLGDVCIVRKYPLFYNSLEELFKIASISDIYSSERLNCEKSIGELIKEIKDRRLKGNLSAIVENGIKNDIVKGNIKYFSLGCTNPILSEEFIDQVKEGDIVDISTPNKFHICLSKQILERPKAHLLIEKPLSHSIDEVLEFREYLKNNNFDGRVIYDAEHY